MDAKKTEKFLRRRSAPWGLFVKDGHVSAIRGQTGGTVAGAHAVVEAGQATSRVTATRALALGVFALAAKKNTGQSVLTITGDGYQVVVGVPVRQHVQACQWATVFNQLAGSGGESGRAATPGQGAALPPSTSSH